MPYQMIIARCSLAAVVAGAALSLACSQTTKNQDVGLPSSDDPQYEQYALGRARELCRNEANNAGYDVWRVSQERTINRNEYELMLKVRGRDQDLRCRFDARADRATIAGAGAGAVQPGGPGGGGGAIDRARNACVNAAERMKDVQGVQVRSAEDNGDGQYRVELTVLKGAIPDRVTCTYDARRNSASIQ